MRKQGITLPKEPVQRRLEERRLSGMVKNHGSLSDDISNYSRLGESPGRRSLNKFGGQVLGSNADENTPAIKDMGMRRSAMKKQGAAFGTDSQWAWPKIHDPFEYWRERTWWFNMEDPEEQEKKIRDWVRLMYSTHYLVPSLIDIYTRFPLLDIELVHPDRRLVQFYEELFFDSLNYEEHLFNMGSEFWQVGEVFSLGSWHDGIGAWDGDEIINPNDVIVSKNRALRSYSFHVKVPEEIKKLIDTREPYAEYQALVQLYPDVISWAREDTEIPVSDVLMKQLKFTCVTPNTDMMTPSGPVPAGELKVGDDIVAWDVGWNRPVISQISHQGLKDPEPLYRITTRFGRILECTQDHPFLGKDGWVKAFGLKVGDQVRVGTSFTNDTKSVEPDLARFIGLMVGDGGYGHDDFIISNVDTEIISWLREFLPRYGCTLGEVQSDKCSYRILGGRDHQLTKVFRDQGILGQTSYTKRVPQCIWEGTPEIWWNFLAGYFDADGSYSENGSYGQVVFTSCNRKLLEDVQLLLSLLEVPSSLRSETTKAVYKGENKVYQGWILNISREEGRERLAQNMISLLPRKTVISRDMKNRFRDTARWDTVLSIEEIPDGVTCAIGVETYYSHITAGLVTHNTNPWSEHGTPILLRAFRTLMMEESLNAAQDAIADRLYSPLILATLGLPDVDQDGPWIPDGAELQALRDDLAMAINADFRLMVYHHGLDIKNAFGREAMPRLDQDFLRQESKLMQVFGISPELLQGGKSGVAYSSSSLNRELITQMLSTYQVYQQKFLKERFEAVAERQGHYEYRRSGSQRFPIMENVLVVDEETGEEYVEERPKLAIPEVKFKAMNLRDEATERQFMQELAGSGFPVSFSTMAVNIPIDFDEEGNARMDEKIKSVVWEQQMKKNLWQRLRAQGLPIPLEMMEEYQSYLETQENPELLDEIEPQVIADISSMPPSVNISGPGPQTDLSTGESSGGGEGGEPQGSQTPPDLALPGQEGNEQAGQAGPPDPTANMPRAARVRQAEVRWLESQQEELLKEAALQKESILDNGFTYDDPENDEPLYQKYSNKKAFGTPRELSKRVKQRLPQGIKIASNDKMDHYDEDEFQEQLDKQRKFISARDGVSDDRTKDKEDSDEGNSEVVDNQIINDQEDQDD